MSRSLKKTFLTELQQEFGGICEICNLEPAIFIDHCHNNNKVRGLLCNRCNVGLGFWRDSVNLLLSAIRYLIKYSITPRLQTYSKHRHKDKDKLENRSCDNCNSIFSPKIKTQKFCSLTCRISQRNKRAYLRQKPVRQKPVILTDEQRQRKRIMRKEWKKRNILKVRLEKKEYRKRKKLKALLQASS